MPMRCTAFGSSPARCKALRSRAGKRAPPASSESEPEKGVLRVFDCYLPFSARLTVHLPGDTRLVILDSASPVSARKRSSSPACCETTTSASRFSRSSITTWRFSTRTARSWSRSIPRTCPSICSRKSTFARTRPRSPTGRNSAGSASGGIIRPDRTFPCPKNPIGKADPVSPTVRRMAC